MRVFASIRVWSKQEAKISDDPDLVCLMIHSVIAWMITKHCLACTVCFIHTFTTYLMIYLRLALLTIIPCLTQSCSRYCCLFASQSSGTHNNIIPWAITICIPYLGTAKSSHTWQTGLFIV